VASGLMRDSVRSMRGLVQSRRRVRKGLLTIFGV
jgi:hypothetical protein